MKRKSTLVVTNQKPSPGQQPCFQLREKVFQLQDSKLTQLFVSRHVKSSFNLIFALVFWSLLLNVIFFVTHRDELSAFTNFIKSCVRGFNHFLLFELVFHGLILTFSYHLIRFWVQARHGRKNKLLQDTIFGTIMGAALVFVYVLALYQISVYQLPPSIKMAILCEKVRLTMKLIAFIVECRNKQEKNENQIDKKALQNFSSKKQLFYFLFAPTIVYRDHYPRAKSIRWSFVATYFSQFMLGLVVLCIIFYRFVIPTFSQVGLVKHFALRDFLNTIFFSLLTGIVFQMFAFYLVLHCWMNGWAELLRFGDRTFYLDWWNSTSYSVYYRKWNVVVGDWIYAYFYVWIVKKTRGNKGLSTFFVFLLSSIIHEYILSVAFGVFFPVLTIQFLGFGSIAFFIELLLKKLTPFKNTVKVTSTDKADIETIPNTFYPFNFLIITTLFSGWSSMFFLYALEHFARQNCVPVQESGLASFFHVYTFSCVKIYN